MSFQLSSEIDQTKFFLINNRDIEARLDVEYYQPYHYQDLQRLENSPHSLKKLDHICTRIVDGPFGSAIKANDYVEHGIPFIRVADVTHGEGTIKTNKLIFISEEVHEKIKRSKVVPNDVVIAKTGATMGAASVIPEAIVEANIRGDLGALTVKKELCTPQYVITFINTAIGQRLFWRLDSGGTRGRVVIGNLKKYPIIIPPKEIQEEIVLTMQAGYAAKKQKEAEAQQLLDSIDDYLLAELGIELPEQEENTVQNRIFTRRLSEISNGRFDAFYYKPFFKMVGDSLESGKYEISTLSKISLIIGSGATPLSGHSEYYTDKSDGIPFVRSGEINEFNLIDFDESIFITEEVHNKMLNSSKIKNEDVLIAIVGATIGAVSVFKYDKEANINQAIAFVRLKKEFDPEYIKNFLLSKLGKSLLDKTKRPVARANINLDEVGSIQISLPPLERQIEIANHITQIRDKAKQLQQQAKAELEQAKKEVEAMILGEV